MQLDLVNNTPPVYTEESRDFQLFLRLYEAALNSTKNDIDLMPYMTDTKFCKTEMLSLLQTKFGFVTNHSITGDMLRNILIGFPYLLKHKGSFSAIKGAINLFLKTLNIKTDLMVYLSDTGDITLSHSINDHTVVIGINEAINNFYVLEELFHYILPAGYGYSFFFFKNYSRQAWFRDLHSIDIIYTGEYFADRIRENILPYDSTKTYKVNDTITVQVSSTDTKNTSYVVYRCWADNYSEYSSYAVGDLVIHADTNTPSDETLKLWSCTTAITAGTEAHEWDEDEWEQITVTGAYNSDYWQLDELTNQMLNAVDTTHVWSSGYDYDSTVSYSVNEYCVYNLKTYKCITATHGTPSLPEAFDLSKWQEDTAIDSQPYARYNNSVEDLYNL